MSAAMGAATGREGCPALVRPASDPAFGDYQADGVMAMAKQLRTNPGKLARQVVAELDVSDICQQPEVAGPGFINLRLKNEFVAERLLEIFRDPNGRLGIERAAVPKRIVVDFSSPNIAKQMHVGHLRSTTIGDCICRMLEFAGHTIIRQNHIGDWGTPMGMIAYALWNYAFEIISRKTFSDTEWGKNLGTVSLDVWEKTFDEIPVQNLDEFVSLNLDALEDHYRNISSLESTDPKIAGKVREFTANLQSGKSKFIKKLWEQACRITLKECYELYDCLNVTLQARDTCGESFYADILAGVVEDLRKRGLAQESQGAICVFPPGFKNKKGEALPFMIQKSDGAYLYATTDLAALRHRVRELKADAIIYVTDARQKLHFEMLFATARLAGWATEKTELVHVMFGSVLGEDGRPLKTREGENVKLKVLLDEAIVRARAIVEEKNPDLSEQKKEQIARAVGIGAVKYADFSNSRTSDYVFSFDKMLAMEGNTAPYMQYAYARVQSIKRKGQEKGIEVDKEMAGLKEVSLTEPSELDLAKHLIRYGEAVAAGLADYRPHYLTTYLYDLAQKFSVFYTNCPVLDAGPDKRPTRLLLCDLTARTIKHGLAELLGIEVVEQM